MYDFFFFNLMQGMLFFLCSSCCYFFFLLSVVAFWCCSESIQIDISENQWNKSSFFSSYEWIGNMSIVNIMYSCMISCCARKECIPNVVRWGRGRKRRKKILAFNNMHLIAFRDGITEKIRLEKLSEISKSNFAIKQGDKNV